MKFLADANVVSEVTKQQPSARVLAWLGEHSQDIVVDAIIIAEIWRGVDAMPAGRKRQKLTIWFQNSPCALRCLPWTKENAIV